MTYFCSQKNRRTLVLDHPSLNGIDYLEVCTTEPDCECGKLLNVTFLKDARSLNLTPAQIQITGGASAKTQAKIQKLLPIAADTPRVLTVELESAGAFSTYTLTLVANNATADPPDGIDPQLATVSFSFKAHCPTVSDCLPTVCCPPEQHIQPDINYLAKDYESFRQVILDRLAVLSPQWNEPNPPDIGVTLVELLAYVADHLSYQQDAVGTEAYLGTARSRISMRRHAKLVDYQISEGCNARAWVYFNVSGSAISLPPGTRLFPRVPGLPTSIQTSSASVRLLTSNDSLSFSTMQQATLFDQQNEIHIYTWSDTNCCLAPGATQATLVGTLQSLKSGSALLFEELLGPETGNSEDADTSKRWIVRLTAVQIQDFQGRVLVDPLNNEPITRVWWNEEDALPFPLCVSSTTDIAHEAHPIFNVSVARGNMVPADHGTWINGEDLGEVPAAPESPVVAASCTCGTTGISQSSRPRYFPQLSEGPLTFASPFDPASAASSLLVASSSTLHPKPQLHITDDRSLDWPVLKDLLSTPANKQACVVEIENDGTAFLRFGDGQYGVAAETGTKFNASYRIGNGTAGNIGRDTLGHVLTNVTGILQIRNPLAAAGGTDPESMTHIRQLAPFAFRSQLRAVTEDDYSVMTQLDPAIFEARGTLRWTGSWYTAFVSVDAASTAGPSTALVSASKKRLNLLRMAGVDLEVEGAILVGLRITLQICVAATHFQSDVRDALMHLFITGDQCNGRPGLLNTHNFTFGQTIYTSPLVAAAQSVDGVSSVTLTTFQRMDDPSTDATKTGSLTMGRLEIARCDNDPNRLDHGLFTLNLDGGK